MIIRDGTTRVKSGSFKNDPYGLLFNPHTDICKNITKIFSRDFGLLKETYLLHNKLGRHSDYDGFVMNQILDLEPSFLYDYVNSLVDGKKYYSWYDNHMKFDFIWQRNDAPEIINPVLELIANLTFDKEINCDGIVSRLFTTDKHNRPQDDVITSQDQYFEKMIPLHASNHNLMELLFSAIFYFENDRKLRFIFLLLDSNKDFDLFYRISLGPSICCYNGNAVSVLSKKRDLWKEIRKKCTSVALLDHRNRCDEVVELCNREIELEKKRDFIGF